MVNFIYSPCLWTRAITVVYLNIVQRLKNQQKTKYCKTKAQNWFVMEAIIEKLFSTLNEIVEEKNKHDFN